MVETGWNFLENRPKVNIALLFKLYYQQMPRRAKNQQDDRSNVVAFRVPNVKNHLEHPGLSRAKIVDVASGLLMLLPLGVCLAIACAGLIALANCILSEMNTFVFIFGLHALAIAAAMLWKLRTKNASQKKGCACVGACAMDAAQRW